MTTGLAQGRPVGVVEQRAWAILASVGPMPLNTTRMDQSYSPTPGEVKVYTFHHSDIAVCPTCQVCHRAHQFGSQRGVVSSAGFAAPPRARRERKPPELP